MFCKTSDAMRALDRALDSPIATALALLTLLAVPLAATSGLARPDASQTLAESGLADDGRPNYEMRCWQQGRLLFSAGLDALPTDGTRYSFKVSGTDGRGRPVYVAETSQATCLIRGMADEGPAHAG